MIVVWGLALYGLAGAVIALAFVLHGVTRVLPGPISMSPGARMLIFPGAAALWPYVLLRWMKSAK